MAILLNLVLLNPKDGDHGVQILNYSPDGANYRGLHLSPKILNQNESVDIMTIHPAD